MASTYTLDRTIRYVRRFINRAPLTFSDTNDPAMMMADWVRNQILAPPFAWRWNRATTQLTLATGVQDYVKNLPNFGWLESANVVDTVSSPNAAFRCEVALNDEGEIVNNQPNRIGARIDDNNGNITFRVMPPPTANFTVANLTYQNASPKFASLSDTWAPIPDYFQNIYQQGFLAKAYEYMGDERFPATMQMFARSLVGANGGLTQSQTNIFLAEMMITPLTSQNMTLTGQNATQSRSLV